MEPNAKWYTKTLWIAVLLVFFFPVGLFLMWKYSKWNKWVKWGITIFFGLVVLGSATSSPSKTASITETKPTPTTSTAQQNVQPTEKPVATSTPAPVKKVATPTSKPVQQTVKPTSAPVASQTVSQRNALAKAKSYLSFSAFSHDGLIAQLEYEQFSHEDAVYGADNVGANWNDQAAKKAKSYMDMTAFSRGSLIDQLIYDKFTQEQAEYGATSVGL
jgi:cytoskeletal protein RodZ